MVDLSHESLLVSIHDVTPALEIRVRELWTLCVSHGVVPALLVVPNWHGQWPLEAHVRFMDWVRECASAGAEILLHGERHDETGLPRGWRDELRAFGRTAGEGEFLTLDRAEATARIARGLTLLHACKLEPIGFVPPAWLAREDTHQAAAHAGLAVTEDDSTVRVHRPAAPSQVVDSPVLRWSGRSTWRALGSRAAASLRWRTQRHAALVRLALHPQDLEHRVTKASVVRELARWTGARRTIRYASL